MMKTTAKGHPQGGAPTDGYKDIGRGGAPVPALSLFLILVFLLGCFEWPDEGLTDEPKCQVSFGGMPGTDSIQGESFINVGTDSETETQTETLALGSETTTLSFEPCETEPFTLGDAGVDGGDLTESTDIDTDTESRRIVVIADLHGMMDHTLSILKFTGLINDNAHWAGGDTVLIQTGDQVDRGDYDREIIDLFERLKIEAVEEGGEVITLIANHEVMSVDFNFREVTPASLKSFDNIKYNSLDPQLTPLKSEQRGRAAAFRPGGPYAKILAKWPVIYIREGTLFSHAGVLPKFVEMGIDKINEDMSNWLLGHGKRPAYINDDRDTPTWLRGYGEPEHADVDCESAKQTLEMLGLERMVVGHTVQPQGVNVACDGLVYRIDVGMYKHPQIGALIMQGDEITPVNIKRECQNREYIQ